MAIGNFEGLNPIGKASKILRLLAKTKEPEVLQFADWAAFDGRPKYLIAIFLVNRPANAPPFKYINSFEFRVTDMAAPSADEIAAEIVNHICKSMSVSPKQLEPLKVHFVY